MPDKVQKIDPGSFKGLGIQDLPSLYDYAIDTHGSSTIMRKHHPWGYQSITYREFGKLISLAGAGLIDSGLEKGDRVILIAENSPEWLIVFAAVTACGGVAVPLDPRMRENEIRHLMIHSGASFVITSPGLFGEELEETNLGGVKLIVIGEQDKEIEATTLGGIMARGKEKIAGGDSSFFKRKSGVSPEDIAAICYTSGTTGRPRGAVLLHRNLISDVESVHSRLDVYADDVFLCILPLYHTFALTTIFLAPLLRGSTIAFARAIKPRIILEDVQREKVTLLVGVPLIFEHLAGLIRKSAGPAPEKRGLLSRLTAGIRRLFRFGRRAAPGGPAAVPDLRFCISGAARLRPDVEETLLGAGFKVLQGYGLTEASPVVSVNPFDKPRRGTVGPPLPGVEVRIDNPGEGGVGEILVRGGNVMKEYYGDPDATGSVLKDGFLHTGDLGAMDGDGFITIHGRKKSLIVTAGGKNVHPEEIEDILNSSGMILESIVLEVEDRKGNIRPGAIIVPDYDALIDPGKAGGRISEEKIRSMISEEIRKLTGDLPDYKHIYEFRIRDTELPRTPTNKLKRHLVKWIED